MKLRTCLLLVVIDLVGSRGQLDDDGGYVLYIKPSRDFYDRRPPPNCTTRCQARPGKMGPAGPRGLRGFPGPKAVVNLTVVEHLQQQLSHLVEQDVNNKVKIENLTNEVSQLKQQQGTFQSFVEEMNNITGKLLRLTDHLDCPEGGITLGASCFFVIRQRYNFEAAKAACRDENAHLAYIKSLAVYNALDGFLRAIVVAEGRSTKNFRLGGTYDLSSGNGEINYLDGSTIDWTKWHANRIPSYTNAGYTSIQWHIRADETSEYNGLFNHPPNYTEYALCQK